MAQKKQRAEVVEVRGDLKDGLGEPFIPRSKILDTIEACLVTKRAETADAAQRVLASLSLAEALIEFLEAADCGSYGGYGLKKTAKGMVDQDRDTSHYTLRERYDWLKSMPLRKMF